MVLQPPRATRTNTLVPYTTLVRSIACERSDHHALLIGEEHLLSLGIDAKHSLRVGDGFLPWKLEMQPGRLDGGDVFAELQQEDLLGHADDVQRHRRKDAEGDDDHADDCEPGAVHWLPSWVAGRCRLSSLSGR